MKIKGESIGEAVMKAIREAAKVDPKTGQFLKNLEQIPSPTGKADVVSHFLGHK